MDKFGIQFIVHIFAGQHLLRGLAEGLSDRAIPYLFKELHIVASKINIYKTIIKLAYSCKTLIAFCSDVYPLFGFRQMPLLIIAGIAGLSGYVCICALPQHMQTPMTLVFLLFLTRLQSATTEVLTEAQVSVRIKDDPENGPGIVPFLSGGVLVLLVVSAMAYGLMMTNDHWSPRSAMGVCACLAVPVFFTAFSNFQGEARLSQEQILQGRKEIFTRPALVLLGIAVNGTSIALAFLEIAIKSSICRFIISVCSLVVMIVPLNLIMRPEVAKATTTYTVMISLVFELDGATFYFLTDTLEQYPEGPHFSALFYNGVLQTIGVLFLLLGLGFYSRYMMSWTYRNSLICTVLVSTIFFLPDVILFSRVNRDLIPDEIFVLGTQALKSVPHTWGYCIILSLTAHFCPDGMEATVFALLSSYTALGCQVNNYFGAFLLERLNVNPRGTIGESVQFNYLWLAALIAAFIHLCSLPFIFIWIPNNSMRSANDDYFRTRESITSGTWYSNWLQDHSSFNLG